MAAMVEDASVHSRPLSSRDEELTPELIYSLFDIVTYSKVSCNITAPPKEISISPDESNASRRDEV